MGNFRYDGPQEAMVRRAAITLKLCDHWVNGSLVAAPTSSLPALELTGTGPRTDTLVPLTLGTNLEPGELPAYGQLLLDILKGNSALSIRADEAEESWRIVTPVLDGWSRNLAPLEEYAAGSRGPEPRV
jgi:hypothetical protein